VYLTWDLGRSLSPKSRHANVVMQKSADGGNPWGPISVISPGFPDHGGGMAAPLLVEARVPALKAALRLLASHPRSMLPDRRCRFLPGRFHCSDVGLHR